MTRFGPILLGLALVAGAAPSFALLDKTAAWREEVILRSGEALVVDRTVAFGPDAFFRPGRGGISRLTLSFAWKGRKVSWRNEDPTLGSGVPLALDIAEGVPVLVLPVLGARACDAHGYPQDGLSALRWEGGKWVRANVKSLPSGIRVNLLQNVWSFAHEPPAKGLLVNARWKQQAEAGITGNQKQGYVVGERELSEHSCARIRPPPDPALDAATAEVLRAEQRAGTVLAQRTAFTTTAETVSAADLRQNLGTWRAVSWIAESCRDVVAEAESRNIHTVTPTSTSSHLSGYLVKLKPEGRIAFRDAVMTIGNIACGDSIILVVRRNAGDRVLVDRFDRSGRVIDATWVQLPGAAEAAAGPNAWAPIWNVSIQGGARLTIVLADYAYAGTMNEGGTLRRKAVYEARLPAI